ncbi:NAD(P)/FAD-dependent oxidoreductase [Halobacillus sp. Marseille-Q1614]|uniref:phytoene desaturase family protein n=1 Tax=Halobacillus sp. Marseille-Q1614 TaxID=2709134 RepID=UPI001571191C|nr:phytoene desaturase family protein [Halobacillus sp. Marseille-Q1614]
MKTVIVGGGLGGLSAAVSLAKEGVEVELFEKNDHFGGKMMPVDEGGYHFDFGPNTITMPHVFQNVMDEGRLPRSEQPVFHKLTNHTRNQWEDGTVFDLSTDRSYIKQQLQKLDPKAESTYDDFLKEAERLYDLSNRHFINRSFLSFKDYISLELAVNTMKVRPFQSMNSFFSKYFSHQGIVQSLNRYATYIGSSPYRCPATFAMIAHLELNDGVYYVKGGNTRIAAAFVKAARNQGAKLHSGTEVTRLLTSKNKITGVQLSNGEKIHADHVILNGDLLHTLPRLLNKKERRSLSDRSIERYDPSVSAFVIMAGLNTKISELHHHHVFFSSDYEKEFKELTHGQYSSDPTVYICTSSKSDAEVSPRGDNCFILVNAPPVQSSSIEKEAYKKVIYDKLHRNHIEIKKHVSFEKVIGPEDIESQFYSFKGALYGPSSNTKVQAFRRPYNQSQDYSNLYFCGGSTHPGGGSPMVVLSGQNVAHHLIGKRLSME